MVPIIRIGPIVHTFSPFFIQIAATLPLGTIIPWVNRPQKTYSGSRANIPRGWQRYLMGLILEEVLILEFFYLLNNQTVK